LRVKRIFIAVFERAALVNRYQCNQEIFYLKGLTHTIEGEEERSAGKSSKNTHRNRSSVNKQSCSSL